MRIKPIVKRLQVVFLCCCLLNTIWPTCAYAEGKKNDDTMNISSNNDVVLDDIPVGVDANLMNKQNVEQIVSQIKFKESQGHGFAAEQGNNFIDKIKGKNTIVVGDNNIKNGPDRLIKNHDGTVIEIQDKYYKTASGSINACFKNENFKYIDGDGKPMRIEVPKDQYDEAIEIMAKKIENGQIPDINDPAEAKNIVKKGNLTYNQAKNLAKAGTIESLTYDAANGAVIASGALGISTVLNYAVCRLNGQEREEALRTSAIEGVKTGAGIFATSVIVGQLTKTGIVNVFEPSSKALTRALGENFSKALLKAYGQTILADTGESTAQAATKQAAQFIRSSTLFAVVSTIVFSVPDGIDVFRGRISKKQFVKNFAVNAVSVVAGVAGAGLGGAIATLVVPGVGTIPGTIVGSIIGGVGGAFVADKISDYITDDDADEMYEILETQFAKLCEDYLVNEEEVQSIATQFNSILTNDLFKDMYQSADREQFAIDSLEPLFEAEISMRTKIEAPAEEEMRAALKEELKGVVFIH